MLLAVLISCEETATDCGEQKFDAKDAHGFYFSNPADIYWGITDSVRSYTYNYEFGNICTKQNPKVTFNLELFSSNAGSTNPVSVSAGVYTCLGVQAQHFTLVPDNQQRFYASAKTEIGMQQCFGSKSSATIYPYMTVSFNTFGSSYEDSLYLMSNVIMMSAQIDYNVPK